MAGIKRPVENKTAYCCLSILKYSTENEYSTPNELIGVKKTMVLLKILRMPISPSLRIFTNRGSAAKEMTFVRVPITVNMPTCFTELLFTNENNFENK